MVPAALVVMLAAGAAAPLVEAVKSGDVAAARTLMTRGADVNAAEADGTTALHWAVQRNDVELVTRLLKAGARVNATNQFGSTPMFEAAVTGNATLIERLLAAGADVESPNADGQTALMVAARTGQADAVRLLLKKGARVNATEQWHGQSALMWAVAQGHSEVVRELIAHGADVNLRSTVNNWQRQVTGEPRAVYRPAGGLTPLLFAARQGCVECVDALVSAGAGIDVADPEGITPLNMAVLNMHFDTAAALIRRGANPNKWDLWGRAPLYSAVDVNTLPRGGRPDMPSLDKTTGGQVIGMLLEAGANPNQQLKLPPPFRNVGNDRGLDRLLITGSTPLLRAAKALDTAAVTLLVAHGATLELTNSAGVSPTMAAAGVASVDADTRGIYTTADVQQRAIATLDLLLAAGGRVDGRDNRGLTALHEAARWGWNDVVTFLVAHGADLDAKDNRGNTPVDAALGKAGGNSRGGARIDVHEDTAALLKKLIADRTAPAPAAR
jgi:ankyrin repeat protein